MSWHTWLRLFLAIALNLALRASAEGPTPVFQMYEGPARPVGEVARLYIPSNTWVRTVDGRAFDKSYSFLGGFMELIAGPHTLRAIFQRKESGLVVILPCTADLAGGGTYKVEWTKVQGVHEMKVVPYPDFAGPVREARDTVCWLSEIRGTVVEHLIGKRKELDRLTITLEGGAGPRTWNSRSGFRIVATPSGLLQKAASELNYNATAKLYPIMSVAAGRRVKVVVLECAPERIAEVIIED